MTSEHPEQPQEPQDQDQDPDALPDEEHEQERADERAGGDAEAAGSTGEREAVARDDDDLFGGDDG